MPYDKILHFLAGIVAYCVGASVRPAIGIGLALAAGAVKEVHDYYDYGGFDWSDMAATWAGGITGYIITEAIRNWIF